MHGGPHTLPHNPPRYPRGVSASVGAIFVSVPGANHPYWCREDGANAWYLGTAAPASSALTNPVALFEDVTQRPITEDLTSRVKLAVRINSLGRALPIEYLYIRLDSNRNNNVQIALETIFQLLYDPFE
jgi:hypothetical protein